MIGSVEKKLLVLDVNGLLVETFHPADKRPKDPPPDGKLGNHKFVYKRPFCDQFIKFCFQNFVVGIWSSAQKQNVDKLVDFIFGDLKKKLLFCWYQTDCTDTGLRLPENRRKPLFLKELSKLWNKVKPDLPWEGQYGPSNTLMIDDSPYKALCNPPHTAVFPDAYEPANKQDDILGICETSPVWTACNQHRKQELGFLPSGSSQEQTLGESLHMSEVVNVYFTIYDACQKCARKQPTS